MPWKGADLGWAEGITTALLQRHLIMIGSLRHFSLYCHEQLCSQHKMLKDKKRWNFTPVLQWKQLFVSFWFPGAIPKGAVGQPGTNNKLPFALCIPRWELAPSSGSQGSFPRRTGAARHWWTSRCAGSFSSRCSGSSLQWATSFPGTLTVSSCWYIPFWWSLVH